jgi:hypothetical protein
MPLALCVQNVVFGATGETYESGKEYDVPAATLKGYPDYFEKMVGTAENKMVDTAEDKAEAAE